MHFLVISPPSAREVCQRIDTTRAIGETGEMRRVLLGLLTGAIVLCIADARAAAPAELAVAIRHLQAEGVSHSHIYLYREDGKLLRQLSNDNSGQDVDPVFSPDGSTIVFSREKKADVVEFWSITPLGQQLHRLDAAPDWYAQTHSSPYFTNFQPEPIEGTSPDPGAADPSTEQGREQPEKPRTFRAPDDSAEVVVRRLPNDEDDAVDGEGTGKHFLLRDLRTQQEIEMGTLPGFFGLWDVLHLQHQREKVFLLEGALRVVFFSLHVDSTAGDTVFALDLNKPHRLVRLSENWAAPIPLAGEPAFLTFTQVRYVPIPKSKKTANCSYLERWNAKLEKVRFAAPGSAAVCYGASIYRPGYMPAVVSIRRDAD